MYKERVIMQRQKRTNCVNICKHGGAKFFQQSHLNHPNQGHQPWQSNSLGKNARADATILV